MIKQMFTIYDSKVEAYLDPFLEQTVAAAIRSFSEAAADAGHMFHKHAADFTLFQIGSYDQTTGECTMLSAKVNLGLALEHLPPTRTDQTIESQFPRSIQGGE